ncbi:hypothetical protein H5410_041042 [Solanum commersonii]|uniref:Uncharacterized protein n=1 Tax=Solanum commersonii TaxID=4109 RepID=A0A9J5XTQ0_SOLCO|nr:hypothetical protein H5410_041042 [Solanum commersonii]
MQKTTLVFCDAEDSQLKRKSHFFPINDVPRIQHRLDILGGEIGKLPSTYLDMLLGVKSKSKEI